MENTYIIEETISLNEKGDGIATIDQSLLPNEERKITLRTKEDVWDAIKTLKVRGAPVIGICAAYGIYLAVRNCDLKEDLFRTFRESKDYLNSARPTAVNLSWALEQMDGVLEKNREKTSEEIRKALLRKAERMKADDIKTCRKIGENTLNIINDGDSILTHCNAGSLATVKYGTALAGIYMGIEKGWNFNVYADETRPLLQGARLTSYELSRAGANVTLICDNMAASVMKKGLVDIVLVGADRIAANGDTANKIGTSALAVLAKYYNIPFYVCAPTSTIDMACSSGDKIVIEERDGSEITEQWYEKRMAPDAVNVINPAFDVTDHELITGIITEKGILTFSE